MGGTGDGIAGTLRASQRRIALLSDGAATAAAAAGAPTCETTCSRRRASSRSGGGGGGDGGGDLYLTVSHICPSRMRASFSKSTDRSRPSLPRVVAGEKYAPLVS